MKGNFRPMDTSPEVMVNFLLQYRHSYQAFTFLKTVLCQCR